MPLINLFRCYSVRHVFVGKHKLQTLCYQFYIRAVLRASRSIFNVWELWAFAAWRVDICQRGIREWNTKITLKVKGYGQNNTKVYPLPQFIVLHISTVT